MLAKVRFYEFGAWNFVIYSRISYPPVHRFLLLRFSTRYADPFENQYDSF